MIDADVVVGRRYAFRARPKNAADALVEVKVVAKVGRKGIIKVRWIGGETPGLEEYVKTNNLVVAWGDRRAFLRDEERLHTLSEASAQEGDAVRKKAVELIIEATGEPREITYPGVAKEERFGILAFSVEAAKRLAARGGLSEDDVLRSSSWTYVDRHGVLRMPHSSAARLAKAVAEREPEGVARYIDGLEREWKAEGYQIGERFSHDYLREHEPAFALVRQWAGFEASKKELHEEIERLRRLVWDAISALKAAGAEKQAHRIERGVHEG